MGLTTAKVSGPYQAFFDIVLDNSLGQMVDDPTRKETPGSAFHISSILR